ncbi:MAG TPA: ABC transporter substrate-binding protein [Acidimicrobiales bacterium]|jgi:peptide/nickel transport system substrate-binding protein|nr:ABC transporter substrate-binding protein [Acidimicrobiales bacterium]
MSKNHWRLSIATLVVASALAGCGSSGSDSSAKSDGGTATTAATKAPEAGECTEDKAGGSVTMGVYSETTGLDPTVSSGAGVTGGSEMAAIYDSLMRYNTETGEYDPWVAESLEGNEDSTVWTLKLREGVEFGNGDPLTAEAVKASIARHQDPEEKSRWLGMASNIEEMEVVDDLTLEFTLTEPFGTFPYVLAAEPGLIVNTKVVDEMGKEAFNAKPTGAGVGPFEIVSFTPGEGIKMKAKSDYWGGPVCLENLNFVQIKGGQATYDALQKDEVQAAFLREPRVIDEARKDGVSGFVTLQHGGELLLMNNGVDDTTPPTADVRIRKAIAAAIDTEVLDQRVNEGTGISGSAIFPEQSRYYQGQEGPAYDLEEAKRLVEEVKAEGDWDGTIEFDCDNTPMRTEMGITIQAMLEAAGFDVKLDSGVTIGDVIQKVRVDRDFELACWGLSATEALPWVKLDELYSSTNKSNHTGYADPDYDAALAELKAATDLDGQKAALAKIQDIWNDTVPAEVLTTSEEVIFVNDELKGVVPGHNAYTYFGDAYLES